MSFNITKILCEETQQGAMSFFFFFLRQAHETFNEIE